ncbi:glutamate racemase [Granulicella paludicola]|uniref:glutamate racemase n=1 Tax=Granulicella paludicola TaxID=474951 RepID=UPI0021E0EA94|nr:glutamate racemase [Granulicella paludicola]
MSAPGTPSAHGPVIGVFDSGFGGLTVLRALLPRIPGAHYLYVGDTARLPYGAKSQATIARYAVESARLLEQRGAEYLVIACNTATALALPEIRAAVSIPVIGVIEPVVQAAQQKHPGGNVLVLATAATVQSRAYAHACDAHGLHATEKACPLLVPLVEEGWIDHPVTQDVLRIYLSEALADATPQAVLLGCTHYPLIAKQITAMLCSLGSTAEVIDSAEATAAEVERVVNAPKNSTAPAATFECFATDSVEKFQRLGSLFLSRPIATVHLLDLGG